MNDNISNKLKYQEEKYGIVGLSLSYDYWIENNNIDEYSKLLKEKYSHLM